MSHILICLQNQTIEKPVSTTFFEKFSIRIHLKTKPSSMYEMYCLGNAIFVGNYIENGFILS